MRPDPGRRLSILTYHRVLPAPDPVREDIDAAAFSVQMQTLARWFNVLPLPEAVNRLDDGSLPRRAVAITFDDGYADNHDVALPVLQRLGLRATFFVATGYLDGGRMFNDAVIDAVSSSRGGLLDLSDRGLGSWQLDDGAACRRAIASLLNDLKYRPFAERQDTAEWIAARAGATSYADLMMTSEQLRALHDAGMTIGAHTVSHPIMTRLTTDDALAEIVKSREFLECCLGVPITAFAYPNGRPGRDYDRSHADAVRHAGFDFALSTAWGAADPDDDHYQLPRIAPWDRTALRFGLRVVRSYWQRAELLS